MREGDRENKWKKNGNLHDLSTFSTLKQKKNLLPPQFSSSFLVFFTSNHSTFNFKWMEAKFVTPMEHSLLSIFLSLPLFLSVFHLQLFLFFLIFLKKIFLLKDKNVMKEIQGLVRRK